MLQRAAKHIAVVVGLLLGFAASYVQPVDAARNSSGTYSLPSGNPVVSGTTITSANENAFRSDVASEMTDSLSRSGKGPMTAALELANGSAAAPAVSFDSDTDCGFYRIGAGNVGLSIDGTKRWDYSATTSALTGTLTVSAGATVTQSTADTDAVTTTGNGTGDGIQATSSGAGAGGRFSSTSGNAVVVGTGNLAFTGSDPTSTTGYSDTITPENIIKATARICGNAGAAATIIDGFNVSTPAESGNDLLLDFVTDFTGAGTSAICTATSDSTGIFPSASMSASQLTISAYDATAPAVYNLATGGVCIHVICTGAN